MKKDIKQTSQKNSNIESGIEELDYSVYNTLNLISPTLGECYKDDGYNPFESTYEISESDINNILDIKKNCKKIEETPSFIEMGINSCKHTFKLALKNTITLKEELIKKSVDSEILSKKHCDKVILYLSNREALLKKFLSKIKNGSNILEMLQELENLDPELAKLIKSTYEKNFNLKIALDNLILFIMKDAEKNPIKNKNDKENEKPTVKEIIINDIKKEINQTTKQATEIVKNVNLELQNFSKTALLEKQNKNIQKTNKTIKPIEAKDLEASLEKQIELLQKNPSKALNNKELNQLENELGTQFISLEKKSKKDKNPQAIEDEHSR